jgi:hypothetical protein
VKTDRDIDADTKEGLAHVTAAQERLRARLIAEIARVDRGEEWPDSDWKRGYRHALTIALGMVDPTVFPSFTPHATPAKAEGYTGEGTLTANPDGTATLTPAKAEGLGVERLARAIAPELRRPGPGNDDTRTPYQRALEYAERIMARLGADTATEGEDR